ncbi:MAG: glycosyltransferase, partial [Bacteroidota bacterium]|nr:glycosyltransferase [Bacteroidota bacterium]
MKKILFVVTTDLNYDQRMQRICSSLQQAGYSVTLLGRVWPVSQPLKAQIYTQKRLKCFFNSGKLFYLEFNIRLLLFLLRTQQHAYCAIDLDTALPVLLKAKLSKKPFIYDAHEYFPEMPEVVRRPFIKKNWEFVERLVIRNTTFGYTVSNSIAAIFKQKYKKSFEVIRNLPIQKPQNTVATSAPYILYQGAVNEGRGLESLLIAMQQVNLPLVICGEGDLLASIINQSKQLGIADRVDFKGYVMPAELAIITQQALVGVMLLENKGLSYYYSLSNKFFDYVQAGIPQIFSNFPEYKQINEQYHIGLPTSLDAESIAATLNKLICDKALYR